MGVMTRAKGWPLLLFCSITIQTTVSQTRTASATACTALATCHLAMGDILMSRNMIYQTQYRLAMDAIFKHKEWINCSLNIIQLTCERQKLSCESKLMDIAINGREELIFMIRCDPMTIPYSYNLCVGKNNWPEDVYRDMKKFYPQHCSMACSKLRQLTKYHRANGVQAKDFPPQWLEGMMLAFDDQDTREFGQKLAKETIARSLERRNTALERRQLSFATCESHINCNNCHDLTPKELTERNLTGPAVGCDSCIGLKCSPGEESIGCVICFPCTDGICTRCLSCEIPDDKTFRTHCTDHIKCTSCANLSARDLGRYNLKGPILGCDFCTGTMCKVCAGTECLPGLDTVACSNCLACTDDVCPRCEHCGFQINATCTEYNLCENCDGLGYCDLCIAGLNCGAVDTYFSTCDKCTSCSKTEPFQCGKCTTCAGRTVDCRAYGTCAPTAIDLSILCNFYGNCTVEKTEYVSPKMASLVKAGENCIGNITCISNLITIPWTVSIELYYDNNKIDDDLKKPPTIFSTERSSCRINSWMSHIDFVPPYYFFGLCSRGNGVAPPEDKNLNYILFSTTRMFDRIPTSGRRPALSCISEITGEQSFAIGVGFDFAMLNGQKYITNMDWLCGGRFAWHRFRPQVVSDSAADQQCPAGMAICSMSTFIENFGNFSNPDYKMVNFKIGCCDVPYAMYNSVIGLIKMALPNILRKAGTDIRHEQILTYNALEKNPSTCAKEKVTNRMVDFFLEKCGYWKKLECAKKLPYSGTTAKIGLYDLSNCPAMNFPDQAFNENCFTYMNSDASGFPVSRPTYTDCTPYTRVCSPNQFISGVDVSLLLYANYVTNRPYLYTTFRNRIPDQLYYKNRYAPMIKLDFKCSDFRDTSIRSSSISDGLYGGTGPVYKSISTGSSKCKSTQYAFGFSSQVVCGKHYKCIPPRTQCTECNVTFQLVCSDFEKSELTTVQNFILPSYLSSEPSYDNYINTDKDLPYSDIPSPNVTTMCPEKYGLCGIQAHPSVISPFGYDYHLLCCHIPVRIMEKECPNGVEFIIEEDQRKIAAGCSSSCEIGNLTGTQTGLGSLPNIDLYRGSHYEDYREDVIEAIITASNFKHGINIEKWFDTNNQSKYELSALTSAVRPEKREPFTLTAAGVATFLGAAASVTSIWSFIKGETTTSDAEKQLKAAEKQIEILMKNGMKLDQIARQLDRVIDNLQSIENTIKSTQLYRQVITHEIRLQYTGEKLEHPDYKITTTGLKGYFFKYTAHCGIYNFDMNVLKFHQYIPYGVCSVGLTDEYFELVGTIPPLDNLNGTKEKTFQVRNNKVGILIENEDPRELSHFLKWDFMTEQLKASGFKSGGKITRKLHNVTLLQRPTGKYYYADIKIPAGMIGSVYQLVAKCKRWQLYTKDYYLHLSSTDEVDWNTVTVFLKNVVVSQEQ